MNNKLKEKYVDETTGMEYRLERDYYIPNLVMPKQEKFTLNKYGRLKLNYLKEHKKGLYTELILDGKLQEYIKKIQETAEQRIKQLIEQLKTKSNLTEDMKNTDMIYWVGTMNSIKTQAEEIVLNELIYI